VRLDWTDVDFMTGRIRIPGTKNATRDRTIDLDPQLVAALQRVPPARRSGPVLRPWANACTDLRAACDRAGIERVTQPIFRHTFGS
jgi:integrase